MTPIWKETPELLALRRVRWSAWLGDGNHRCSACHGATHTLGECPGCGMRDEMEESVKRLNRAIRLYEQSLLLNCDCSTPGAMDNIACNRCAMVVEARRMDGSWFKGMKSPNDQALRPARKDDNAR
jgi:hypothetical protein